MKKFISFVAALLLAVSAFAQEVQFQYDFHRSKVAEKPYLTTTLTQTAFDKWGSTFYFVDFDFTESPDKVVYGEVQRALNFWQNTALKDMYVLVEYNGGILPAFNGVISQAFLTGIGYSFHDESFRNFLQLQVLYRHFFGNTFGNPNQDIPVQLTAVYTCRDLFNVKGLLFSGFADFWWQDKIVAGDETSVIFSAEPQLWYNVGQHFGVNNLHVGGEVEVSVNAYDNDHHFTAWPAAGIRWTF